ncbi:hypothetical protein LUZ61_003270 [Rhynchospora tenuis]|uniref:Wound-induced protein 1 n=1 Tax=Rhynchospora tenuis TaxID=198213 RepID=A0AAD6ESN6_9POAL|nr:hypothetical protein LUZ61_003270 [Rhynchospora tenuis]
MVTFILNLTSEGESATAQLNLPRVTLHWGLKYVALKNDEPNQNLLHTPPKCGSPTTPYTYSVAQTIRQYTITPLSSSHDTSPRYALHSGGVCTVQYSYLFTSKVSMGPSGPHNLLKISYINPPLPHFLSYSDIFSAKNQILSSFFLFSRLFLLFRSKSRASLGLEQELANSTSSNQAAVHESDSDRNKWLVLQLYEALNNRDVAAVHRLLNPDLEWWFHGPPTRQHMMHLLTGAAPDDTFVFEPAYVEAFGPTVLVEGSGSDHGQSVYWVHAWTVGPNGIITQLREYFDTDLTVTRLADSVNQVHGAASSGSSSSRSHCLPVWRSRILDPTRKSRPGLVLAI